MRWFIVICLIFLKPLNIDAAYVVMGNDGQVMEEKEMHRVQSIASISKIMTALIVLENCDVNEFILPSPEGTAQIGSSLYLDSETTYTVIDLLYGLMLRSGNDAAYELAMHVSGSIDEFVKLMNEKAKKLGMNETEFNNPSGLDEFDGGNLSSCYDMALCMNAAMNNKLFVQIVNAKYYQRESIHWKNKNKLLFTYPFAYGGKTGYTIQAGKTLVTAAKNGLAENVVVSFQEGEYFDLHKSLHDNYFNELITLLVIDEGVHASSGILFQVDKPLTITIDKASFPAINLRYEITKSEVKLFLEVNGFMREVSYPLVK